MHFTGFQGMSFHGGVIGGGLGVLFYSIKHKQSFWTNADMMVTAIPFGYSFGRIGNFINAELYGRVTTSPLGMIFPGQNQPRHPSQLYEAFFEGFVLGILMWFVFRKMKLKDGVRVGLYLFCYGLIRFFIEYFREPDADLGFVLLNFTMGQVLCLLMMLFGGLFIIIRSRKTT
jgi:phosphatidylglycerol:prolipoprotein diacylglycerol transferase